MWKIMANVALLFHQWCHGNATFSSQALKMRLQIPDFINYKKEMTLLTFLDLILNFRQH
jgi:hypothetical protein